MGSLEASLADLGLTVSTGRVVDFRAKDLLRAQPGQEHGAPHLSLPPSSRDSCEWPNGDTRKPNALALGPRAEDLLVPAGHYVLDEEVLGQGGAAPGGGSRVRPDACPADRVAFENHLNYYHLRGAGLPATVAKGLAAYLNSTLVDTYFRQFSGHTQVNATDLRSLPYPAWTASWRSGRRIGKSFPGQEELDRLVEEVVFDG